MKTDTSNIRLSSARLRAEQIVDALERQYPDAVCALESGGNAWKLLIMGMLSAQCTDFRVNAVSHELFQTYPDCFSMAEADTETLERLIYSCGLYKTKAKNIKSCSAIIAYRYSGRIPEAMEELLSFPGVGRKIANLVLGDVFGKPAIVTDTHCIRISNRLGLSQSLDPLKTERQLTALIPPEKSSAFCHRLVQFGRETCTAKSPHCNECPLRSSGLCDWTQKASESVSKKA